MTDTEHHTGNLNLTGHGNPEPITVTGPDADLVRALLADPHRNDHILQINDLGWTLQHPVIERVTGQLFDCPLVRHEKQLADLWNSHSPGRYVTWLRDGVIWTDQRHPIDEARS